MSKPSLPFPLVAFEFLTNTLVLVIIASVYGTGTEVFAECSKRLWPIGYVAYARCLVTVFIDLVTGSEWS